MRYEEFKKLYGKFNAYSDWCSVKDAKELGLIPAPWHDVFKDECECGSENIIAPDLKRWMCCDPHCHIKESYKIAEMFSRAGILGLGYAKCNDVYNALIQEDKNLKAAGKPGLFKFNVYTEVLLIPPDKYPLHVQATSAGYDFSRACYTIISKQMTFPQMVQLLGLAGLGSKADKLLEGVNSFTELKDTVNRAGGILPFCAQRGTSSCEMAFNLATAIEEIAVADFACKGSRRQVGMLHLSVCMTGRVAVHGERMTKERFIEACNDLCTDDNGARLLELKNTSGPVTVPFVLYTNASSDHKFNVGASRGVETDDFGKHSVLMTETDFYDWLKGAMQIWNKNLREGTPQEWKKVLRMTLQKDFLTQKTTSLHQKMTQDQLSAVTAFQEKPQ